MTSIVEIHGRVPAGPLTVDDMDKIDIDARFEIAHGALEIMTPPSGWHSYKVDDIAQILRRHFPTTVADVPLALGRNGRRPDVMALLIGSREVMASRLTTAQPDIVAAVAEVISHDSDPWRDAESVRRDRETKLAEY